MAAHPDSDARRGNWEALIGRDRRHWGWARTRRGAMNLFKFGDPFPRAVRQINSGERWEYRRGWIRIGRRRGR